MGGAVLPMFQPAALLKGGGFFLFCGSLPPLGVFNKARRFFAAYALHHKLLFYRSGCTRRRILPVSHAQRFGLKVHLGKILAGKIKHSPGSARANINRRFGFGLFDVVAASGPVAFGLPGLGAIFAEYAAMRTVYLRTAGGASPRQHLIVGHFNTPSSVEYLCSSGGGLCAGA